MKEVLIINKLFKYINIKSIVKITCIVMLSIIIFSYTLNNIYGITNSLYGTDENATIDLSKSASKSKLFTALGMFVYAIAGFVEKIVAKIFSMITGSRIFPWADGIIFNTIAFLDVNFISPELGSLFVNGSGNDTIIGVVIKRLYYTVYSLSVALLGIVVAVIAIKLAISSIADEKARYKSALKKWGITLLLTFTVHYLISFVFYLNEKLVEVASNILVTNVSGYKFFEEKPYKDSMIIVTNKKVTLNTETLMFERTEEDISETEKKEYEKDYENYNGELTLELDRLDEHIDNANAYIRNFGINDFDDFDIRQYYEGPNSDTLQTLGSYFKEAASNYNGTYGNSVNTFFTDMSIFFKDNVGSGKKINAILAFLYAIFVVQSLMYLVSYIKRLFYVIILAMFAPLVVIYDFALGK